MIDGPINLREASARYAVGHYPHGAMISEDGGEWKPLIPAALRRPVRYETVPEPVLEPVPVPVPPAAVRAPALTYSEAADLLAAFLIFSGLAGLFFTMVLVDVGVKTNNKEEVANFHAMHCQLMYLLLSITSILCGTMVVTRRRA